MKNNQDLDWVPADMSFNREVEAVLADIREERLRQEEKWGQQNHGMYSRHERGTAHGEVYVNEKMAQHFGVIADETKQDNDMFVASGVLGWDSILMEEVYEALAELDPEKLYDELIQVAAVAAAAAESVKRNSL
jgi:hypothetical protein